MALTPLYVVRVIASVFQVVGLILTAFRIYFRLKIGRFWWEDAWAGISLLTGSIWMVAQWTFLLTDDLTSIVGSWTYSIGFTCIITMVRMSVLFSITRVIPESSRLRKFTHVCAAFFAACWVILIIEKILQCADPSWHYVPISSGKPFCQVKLRIYIFEFSTDCVAVLILVVLPLRMLWKVRLPRRQRRMILSIFASSIVLAFGALFHTLGQVLNVYIVMIAGINVEIALSLIVCNLLVVVTCTYRFLLHDDASSSGTDSTEDTSANDDDFTRPRTTLHLTTIDLSMSSDCQGTSGITRSEISQSEILQSGISQSGISQSGISQSGTSQSGWTSQEA
ncbi:hypothetical protein PAXINDRAFT_102630 [Paxillus involutus ATCC 200175]|uniref:Rhodopsin domain-containing protein n=1 Tax=Paxillus involutus ATCC 200175 TaxID=664439 RepID=A0A0C9TB67_PAXIN|nr:hypothetical protein PAXINDRAFT_102630 [Paxillus involutus ATCC 200175]